MFYCTPQKDPETTHCIRYDRSMEQTIQMNIHLLDAVNTRMSMTTVMETSSRTSVITEDSEMFCRARSVYWWRYADSGDYAV